MPRNWRLTPFGLEIKKRLLELNITQREFCKENGFNPDHFSYMLYGVRPMRRMREKTAKLLGIKESA